MILLSVCYWDLNGKLDKSHAARKQSVMSFVFRKLFHLINDVFCETP